MEYKLFILNNYDSNRSMLVRAMTDHDARGKAYDHYHGIGGGEAAKSWLDEECTKVYRLTDDGFPGVLMVQNRTWE